MYLDVVAYIQRYYTEGRIYMNIRYLYDSKESGSSVSILQHHFGIPSYNSHDNSQVHTYIILLLNNTNIHSSIQELCCLIGSNLATPAQSDCSRA